MLILRSILIFVNWYNLKQTMLNIVFFDNHNVWENLLPMTYTRSVCDIRLGITTIREKWEREFPNSHYSFITVEYLNPKYKLKVEEDNLFIAGNVAPDDELKAAVTALVPGQALAMNGTVIAFRGNYDDFKESKSTEVIEYTGEVLSINMLYDIFVKNKEAQARDFDKLTAGRTSQPISDTNTIIGDLYFEDGRSKIFIEEGASVEGIYLNVKKGPIYIGKDATIMEGSSIRAPFAACEHATVNMGSRIYGGTTLGPFCKVGGELHNVVMMGYSNKAHEGFLGDAVIGEWCNIGGGTTASNLKNDYTEIKLWNYPAHRFLRTGLQFCGLIMGDHSKIGINCMLNTATVLGVGVNIHGAGFPRNFVPSFSEGGAQGYSDVSLPKFFAIAERMMARRDKTITETDREIFNAIYGIAENYK